MLGDSRIQRTCARPVQTKAPGSTRNEALSCFQRAHEEQRLRLRVLFLPRMQGFRSKSQTNASLRPSMQIFGRMRIFLPRGRASLPQEQQFVASFQPNESSGGLTSPETCNTRKQRVLIAPKTCIGTPKAFSLLLKSATNSDSRKLASALCPSSL